MRPCSLILCLLGATTLCHAEVLFSDSFETPDRLPWQKSWGPAERSRYVAQDGEWSVKETLEDEHGLSVWYLDFPAELRATYRAGAWVYVPTQDKPGLPALSFGRKDWSTLASATTEVRDEWVKLEISFENKDQTAIRLQLFQHGQGPGLGGSVMYWDSVVVEREMGEIRVDEGIAINPHVIEGLQVRPLGGMKVVVDPGKIEIGGQVVEVTQATELELARPRVLEVRDEAGTLTEQEPRGYGQGTPLRACIGDGITLADTLQPETLVVKAEAGPEGRPYVEGTDWRADKKWARIGRLEGGAIAADTTVYVDYAYSLTRLDTIVVHSDGTVALRTGAEAKVCPAPPELDVFSQPLCNVYLPWSCREITPELIYPIGPAFPSAAQGELERNAALIPETLRKLEAGGDFTILFWGDSVTCGGTASSQAKAFPQSFTAWLRNKYPQASIKYVNAGTGGWNSNSKLPLFEEEVVPHRPDLMVIEFVNDMGMDRDTIFANYTKAVSRVREWGCEVVILTPHFVRPDWMPAESMRTPEVRPAVGYLKEFAAENNVGLADASRRWAHLWIEGVPYITYLFNTINHPDDRGHRLFVEELQKFFP